MGEILRLEGITKRFHRRGLLGRRGPGVAALDGVSLSVREGEAFVLAGESGSGKTTLARIVLGAERPDSGSIEFDGRPAGHGAPGGTAALRAGCQMVHQNPYDSLDPRMRVADIVAEPLAVLGLCGGRGGRRARALEALGEAGLGPEEAGALPGSLSGGQRQRVVLARALAPRPRLIVADEPVSMLDASVRAGVLDAMSEMRRAAGIAFLYITHDLATAWHFGDRMAVLYGGAVAESGPVREVLGRPLHPYTRALADAAPRAGPGGPREPRVSEGGPEGGCRFRPRCPCAEAACASEPRLRRAGPGREVACHVDISG